jgi:hypothetical protein
MAHMAHQTRQRSLQVDPFRSKARGVVQYLEVRIIQEELFEARRAGLVEREFISPQRVPKWLKAGPGLRSANARLQPRHQRKPDGLVVIQIVARRHPRHRNFNHADGDKDSGSVSADCRIEVLRRHAEDGEGMAINQHRLAYRAGRSSESRSPIGVAEHSNGIRVFRRIVLLREQAAKRRLHAKKLKVVAGHNFGILVLRLVVPAHANLRAVRGQYAREDPVLVAQVFVHGIREVVIPIPAEAARRSREASCPLETHQVLRLLNRQHPQQHLVEEREHGRVGANAQRQRKNHGERKARRFAQLPQCITDVEPDVDHRECSPLGNSEKAYSVLRACMGSIDAARRAGK